MKLHGEKRNLRQPVPFTVFTKDGSELPVLLKPLPPGFQESQEEEMPWPSPPYRMARDGGGRIVRQRDKSPLSVPTEEDPTYVRRSGVVMRARIACTVVTGLLDDPNFEIEARREDYERATDYWYEAFLEMDRDGLGPVEQARIARQVMEISGLSMDMAEQEAMATFRGRTGPVADGDRGSAQGEVEDG